MSASRHEVLKDLRTQVTRLERGTRIRPSPGMVHLPFGVASIDARLPGGGLRLGALHEIAAAEAGLAHAAARVLFAAGILARIRGPVLWCLSTRDLFAPALAAVGLHPDRVVYVETYREAEQLQLVEEGARFRGLAAVVGDVARISLTASRRLQLCAEASGVTVLLVRHAPCASGDGSVAATRWSVEAVPAPRADAAFGRGRWRIALTRCRGAPLAAEPASWLVEACDEAGRLAAPAVLAHRPHPQARPGSAAAG